MNSDSFLCFKPNEDDMTLMKLKHAQNKWNLERHFLEEENKELRAEIAVAENVQRRLFCQEEESGKGHYDFNMDKVCNSLRIQVLIDSCALRH